MKRQTRTEEATNFLKAGNFKAALAIVSTFRIGLTSEEKRTLEIAHECYTGNVIFYESLGIDTAQEIKKSTKIVNNLLKTFECQ